jgi:hypothetical protein
MNFIGQEKVAQRENALIRTTVGNVRNSDFSN